MKKILLSVAVVATMVMANFGATMFAWAACSNEQLEKGCVETSLLGDNGCYCDNGQGGGITHILNLVYNIMLSGVYILGTLGVIIAGVQYSSAAGDPGKIAKAKNRILQIVIGLLVFAVATAVMTWLIPGWKLPW